MKNLRKGFTLIELLIVIVIIGIIASIALPKFGDVKSQAYRSTMKSDLRTLQTQQELAFNAEVSTGYTPKILLDNIGNATFTPSQNVRFAVSAVNPGSGFIASVNHILLTDSTNTLNALCLQGGTAVAGDITAADALTGILTPGLVNMIQGRQVPCAG